MDLACALSDALDALKRLGVVMGDWRAKGHLSEQLEREIETKVNSEVLKILMHGGTNGSRQK